MVQYNEQDSALTLGDDDSIAVGDYRIQYSSANDRFEVEHPNGEISDVPRSTSGSLVPQGLAESVSVGEALADDGNTYSSVQDAVNAASGWVFVGPGTFNETVSISTNGMTVEGVGDDTVIDSTGVTYGVEPTDNTTIRNVKFIGERGVNLSSSNTTIEDCLFENLSSLPVSASSTATPRTGNVVTNCRMINCGSRIEYQDVEKSVISNNIIVGSGSFGIKVVGVGSSADDNIIANNVIKDSTDSGMRQEGQDTIIIGNRVINAGDIGINNTFGADNSIIANNRVSDSTNSDIADGSSGTVLDGNLTGASN